MLQVQCRSTFDTISIGLVYEYMRCKMFEKVKSVIDEWDPVGLLSSHCPPDEYDDISAELAKIMTRNINVETLGNEIYNIFVRDFGDTFDKSAEECRSIARELAGMMTVRRK